ncbi:MAG: class I SAM-dependent methyltransferase [Pseudomonadota bacterium]
MSNTTFQRSCEHWSEARRGEMDDFYTLARVDYQHLANANDWVSWLAGRQDSAPGRPLRLLDVACGSGKFPAALLCDTELPRANLRPITYDLLDPSDFSIAQARSALAPPFMAGEELVTTLQGLDAASGAYDIVWATHALYAVPEAELDQALGRFLRAMDGVGFIAHSSEVGHYIRCYDHYRQAFQTGSDRVPYSTAEQILASLDRLGAAYRTEQIRYTNGVDHGGHERVEGYLQRCVFDDQVSLEQMLEAEPLATYLRACQRDDQWRFEQHVTLIYLGEDA